MIVVRLSDVIVTELEYIFMTSMWNCWTWCLDAVWRVEVRDSAFNSRQSS